MDDPKLDVMAPETNRKRVHLHVDGEEFSLVPGQSRTTTGRGLVVVVEQSGDACNVTIG